MYESEMRVLSQLGEAPAAPTQIGDIETLIEYTEEITDIGFWKVRDGSVVEIVGALTIKGTRLLLGEIRCSCGKAGYLYYTPLGGNCVNPSTLAHRTEFDLMYRVSGIRVINDGTK